PAAVLGTKQEVPSQQLFHELWLEAPERPIETVRHPPREAVFFHRAAHAKAEVLSCPDASTIWRLRIKSLVLLVIRMVRRDLLNPPAAEENWLLIEPGGTITVTQATESD